MSETRKFKTVWWIGAIALLMLFPGFFIVIFFVLHFGRPELLYYQVPCVVIFFFCNWYTDKILKDAGEGSHSDVVRFMV